MEVTVSLNSCRDCHHIDHSGGYTVRGARLICGHSKACKERVTMEALLSEYPEYKDEDYNPAHFRYHWIHRVLTKSSEEKLKGIPEWCPVKHGSRY